MATTHELMAFCQCPVDNKLDTYCVTVETSADISVETILAATVALRDEKIFQEEFTRRLARSLGATVTTVGYHSGVKTTSRFP
jgi:hypothetical protein